MKSLLKNEDRQALYDIIEYASNLDEASNIIQTYGKKCDEAFRYMQLGNYDEAINLYNSILKNNTKAHFKRLRRYNSEVFLNSYGKEIGEEFISFDELEGYLTAELYNNLGRAHLEKKQYSKAKKYLLKAISISPKKYLNSYLSLGDVFMRECNYNEAKKYYSKAVKLGEPRGHIGVSLANKNINNF